MKKIMFAGMVLALGTVNVFADCTTDSLASASDLVGKSVDASGGGENWKESHCGSGTSGQLWKVGAGTVVDPAVQIGTWSVSGDEVTYDYGSAATTYTWTLRQSGSTYFFCKGSSLVASGTLGSSVCSAP